MSPRLTVSIFVESARSLTVLNWMGEDIDGEWVEMGRWGGDGERDTGSLFLPLSVWDSLCPG